jgi:hypothetical protein
VRARSLRGPRRAFSDVALSLRERTATPLAEREGYKPTYETENQVARKSKEKKVEMIGLIGIGFDNEDGHQRITKAEDIVLVGGSEETHERMQDVAIQVTESLKSKGKRMKDAEPDEVIEIVFKAMDK